MKKLIMVSFCLLSLPAYALIEGDVYTWYFEIEGDVRVGSDQLLGSIVDVQNDFGYDEYENTTGFRITAGGENHQLGIDYFTLDVSAKESVTTVVNFGSLSFPVSTDVASTFEGSNLRGFYRFEAGSDILRGGFTVGLQYGDFKTSAEAVHVGFAEESVEAFMPVIGGFVAGHPLPFMNVKLSLDGGSWEWDDVEATFYDFRGELITEIAPVFYAGLGYRQVMIDGSDKNQNVDIDVTLSGPMAFVGARW